jgi:hypothetical protein
VKPVAPVSPVKPVAKRMNSERRNGDAHVRRERMLAYMLHVIILHEKNSVSKEVTCCASQAGEANGANFSSEACSAANDVRAGER